MWHQKPFCRAYYRNCFLLVYKIVQTYHFSFVMLREREVIYDCGTFRYSKQKLIVKEMAICTEEYIDCIFFFLLAHSIHCLQLSSEHSIGSPSFFMVYIGNMSATLLFILHKIYKTWNWKTRKLYTMLKEKKSQSCKVDCKVMNLDLIACPKFDARGNNSKIVSICENYYPSRIASKLLNQCDCRKANFFFNWLKEPANDEQPEQSQLLETTHENKSFPNFL